MSSLSRVLKIRYPIIQSGMGRVAGPELAAEVSRAGGLGILAGLLVPPDDLRVQIRRARELAAGAPFGVNLWLHRDLRPPIDPATLPAGDVQSVNAALNQARRAMNVAESTAPPVRRADLVQAAIDVVIDERVPVWSVALGLPEPDLIARCHLRGVRIMSM